MKVAYLTIILGLAILLNSSCNSDGFKKTDDGLKYKLFPKNANGAKPKQGDYLLINMLVKSEKDSVLMDTRQRHQAIATLMLPPSFKGGIENGFGMLAVGDSGVFVVSADSIYQKTFQKPIPESIRKGSMLTFYLSMDKITPKAEYEDMQKQKEAEYMKSIAERKEREPEAILKYIKDNKITVKPSATGLYVVNKVIGKGVQPTQGKLVKVNYVGKFLDGSVFDQSDPSKGQFSFHLQQREVVQGWDEGLAQMREGGKATFIVPSSLGYGDAGQGRVIPPYTPMVFEIELVEVGK